MSPKGRWSTWLMVRRSTCPPGPQEALVPGDLGTLGTGGSWGLVGAMEGMENWEHRRIGGIRVMQEKFF